MSRLMLANQSTAAKRRVYFHLVDATDGITPETGEAAGQPQVSSDGAAWTNTGIGTLSSIGNGRYYAELTQTLVATAGTIVETRYKSANTAECPGDSVQVVAFDPDNAVRLGLTALPNVAAASAGGLLVSNTGGGYGSLLMRSAISSVTSQTELGLASLILSNALIGCKIVILRPSTGQVTIGTITNTSGGEDVFFTHDGTAAFTIVNTDIVDILVSTFGKKDRELIDTEIAAIKAKTDLIPAGGGTVDPMFVDEELIWRFEAKDQLTANNTLRGIVGLNAQLAMDFELPIPSDDSLISGTIISVTPSTGLAITAALPSPSKLMLHVSAVATASGEYTVVLSGNTVDGQAFPRRGIIIIESVTGT